MRVGEALSLAWGQIDLMDRTITVGRAKTANGTGRVIPINGDLASILAAHRGWFIERFGEPRPEHCLFPWGKPVPSDPTRHATDITWGWDQLRKDAMVSCRLHDLRHTFATRLAEAGVPESTMLALMGHMSRAMLERYSHIRLAAKRDALAAITLRPDMPEQTQNSDVLPVKVPVLNAHTDLSERQVAENVGERGRNRTFNLLIKSQLLCQLSYAPASLHVKGVCLGVPQ